MGVIEEFVASKWDVPRFARLLGIEGHPGQVRYWEAATARDETGYAPRYLTLALASGNRAGKTLAEAIEVLHQCFYKVGLRPPDPESDRELLAHMREPYHWFHFGILQDISDLVFNEITALLEGRHPGQRRMGCPLIEGLGGRPIAETSAKERGEYRWVQIAPQFGGAEIHFRTTSEKAIGSLGRDMNGISFDEPGFERNLRFLMSEVFNMRRLGTGGQIHLISTPSESYPEFSDEWVKGDPTSPTRMPGRISLRMSTRENIGYGLTQAMFDRILAEYEGMEHLIPQNIDGYFIQGRNAFFDATAVDRAFIADMAESTPPVKGHVYVHGVDPAITHDATWSLVLDVQDGKGTGVKAERRKGKQQVYSVANMVISNHMLYDSEGSECNTGLDTTGFGGKMFKQALEGVSVHNVEFGGTRHRKLRLLNDLKAMLEKGRLRFPRSGPWLELRRQLLIYMIEDKLLETDGVMSLAIAVKMLLMRPEHSTESMPFDLFGTAEEEIVADEHRYAMVQPSPIDRALSLRRNVVTSRMMGP